ncbi:MAG TPA: hypothetical protein VKU90_03630 [Caulobacteraceae bacterium]|nr:hypothetical protein [Caulobacteraceae bacterium]
MDLVGSELRATPDVYPLAFDAEQDSVYFVRLDRGRYEAASFLDQRVIGPGDQGGWAPWSAVRPAAAPLAGDSDFIFHVGHVGSTLLARLLGLSDRVFSLREPGALRTIAALAGDLQTPESLLSEAAFDERRDVLLRLWARTYAPAQRALIKATSTVGEIAPMLLQHAASSRALLVTVAPEVYMATILGGPASRVELRAMAQSRLRRLHRRIGEPLWRLHAMSEGELVAMSWAAEMAGLVEAAERFPGRVAWLDFERFLERPEAGLVAGLQRLHGEASPADLRRMLNSPLFGRYAKGLEHAYDANLRRQVLDQARREHAATLAAGGDWLQRAAAASPVVARSLSAAPG